MPPAVPRSELDRTTDQSFTEPDFRRVNHFRWSWADETRQLTLPFGLLIAELLALIFLGAMHR